MVSIIEKKIEEGKKEYDVKLLSDFLDMVITGHFGYFLQQRDLVGGWIFSSDISSISFPESARRGKERNTLLTSKSPL